MVQTIDGVSVQHIQRLMLRPCRNMGRLSLLCAGIMGCWLGSGGYHSTIPVVASNPPALTPFLKGANPLNRGSVSKNSNHQDFSNSSNGVQEAGLEPSPVPLDLEALNSNTLPPLATRDYQTRSDVSQSDLSEPSLWWRVAEIGDRLLTDWLVYPEARRVDVVVDPQRWNWMSYLDRYRVMMQLANETQPHGYSVRVFDPQEPTQPIASYTCDWSAPLEENAAIETVVNSLRSSTTLAVTQAKSTNDLTRLVDLGLASPNSVNSGLADLGLANSGWTNPEANAAAINPEMRNSDLDNSEQTDSVPTNSLSTSNPELQETQPNPCHLKITGSNQQAWR